MYSHAQATVVRPEIAALLVTCVNQETAMVAHLLTYVHNWRTQAVAAGMLGRGTCKA